MNKIYLLVSILFITTLTNCRYPTEEKDNSIYIDWTDEISASYEYGRYDIYTNAELYAEFEVIRGSGELVITVQVIQGNGSTKQIAYFVKEGEKHIIKIPVRFGGKVDCIESEILGIIGISAGSKAPLKYPLTCELYNSGYTTFIIGEIEIK